MRHGRFDGKSVGDVGAAVARGFVAGCVAGAFASWAMTRLDKPPLQKRPRQQTDRREELASARKPAAKQKTQQEAGKEPTVKVAEMVSREVFDHPLSKNEKQIAGPVVHYGYGTLAGGLYGAVAELMPVISIGGGIAYGTLLWLFGEEIAVPALGLGKSPLDIPVREQADMLTKHFCYGLTLDIGRRVLRIIL